MKRTFCTLKTFLLYCISYLQYMICCHIKNDECNLKNEMFDLSSVAHFYDVTILFLINYLDLYYGDCEVGKMFIDPRECNDSIFQVHDSLTMYRTSQYERRNGKLENSSPLSLFLPQVIINKEIRRHSAMQRCHD